MTDESPLDQTATAGAYVLLDGRFPFIVGPTPDGDRLAVVRLGGHREAGESPWQCAAREVMEESGVIRIPPDGDSDIGIARHFLTASVTEPDPRLTTAPVTWDRGSGSLTSMSHNSGPASRLLHQYVFWMMRVALLSLNR